MMRKHLNACRWLLAFTMAPSASSAVAACFTVFDAAERVVYQSTEAPIDMSIPISQGLAEKYPPRHHLLMSDDSFCPGFDQPLNIYAAPLPGSRLPGNGSPALSLAEGAQNRYRSGGNDAADRLPLVAEQSGGFDSQGLPSNRADNAIVRAVPRSGQGRR